MKRPKDMTPEERRAHIKARSQRQYQRAKERGNHIDPVREYVDNLKRNPCMDCGQCFDPICMDFDHVRGTKFQSVSAMVNSKYNIRQISIEIAKCELVCANCHRLRTKSRSQNQK